MVFFLKLPTMRKIYLFVIALFCSVSLFAGHFYSNVSGLSIGFVNCIETLPTGEVLIGTSTGLFKYDQGSVDFVLPASIHGVNEIALDNVGNVWLATKHVGIVKLVNMQIDIAYSSQNSVAEDNVSCIAIDPSGIVYFGSDEDMYYLQNSQVYPYGLSGNTSSPAVIDIELFQNQVFAVVKDSACVLHGGNIQAVQIGNFGKLFPLENGELYMGDYFSTSIAYMFNGAIFTQDSTFTSFFNIAPHYGYVENAFYRNGNYYYYTRSHIYKIISGGSSQYINKGYFINPKEFYTEIECNSSGEVLIGSSDGLYVYNFNSFFGMFGNNSRYLDFGNIRLPINSQGDIFNDINSELDPMTMAPANSQTSPVFIADLWFSGLDQINNLHVAASRYGVNGRDFFAGAVPVNLNSNYVNAANNRVWKINRSEIEYHIANWNLPGYQMPEVIENWPAHGDPALGEAPILAPFKDNNQNGQYEPQYGDYPIIRGDQTIYFIYNDYKYDHTESGGLPLNIEIHGMAYVFIDSTDAQTIEDTKNTVFFHYTVHNRSLTDYHDFKISLFTDFDIGYAADDYIGCDTTLHCYFAYNGDDFDQDGNSTYGYGYHPPAMGVTFLSHEMQSFTVYNNLGIVPYYMTDPDSALAYFNVMNGLWPNGSPMTFGYSGYGGTQQVQFLYPGNPWNPNEWSDVTSGVQPYDRRGVATIGPEVFPAGQSLCTDFAYVFDREDTTGTNLENVFWLKRRILRVRDLYNTWNNECLYYEHDFINENYGQCNDTLYAYVDTCLFDPTTTIDTAWIENVSVLGNIASVDWVVVQFPDTFHFDNIEYLLNSSGTHFFVLAVLCNSGYRIFGTGQNNVWYFSDQSDADPVDEPLPEFNGITVFPNPSSGLLSVYIPDYITGYSMHVYDLNGKLLYQTDLLGKSNTFDFSYFSKGIYLVQFPEAGKSLKWIKTE